MLNPDRHFQADPATRAIACCLYAEVAGLPILSPHGHTNPQWFADDQPFEDPARLLIVPDHYVFRMLYSQGVPLEALGIGISAGARADGRELAPLAGHYPCLRLGPAWWFHDSPAGMMRYREQTTETAGFYNTVGFNDDTRALLSRPARHDVARRVDCAYLARVVAEHRVGEDEACALARELAYGLAKKAYRL